jgi:hypothetical protein
VQVERQSQTDPVPFLDCEQRPNGAMNGRERLVPGDRLLWFHPWSGLVVPVAAFEIHDYCEVISRTWNRNLLRRAGLSSWNTRPLTSCMNPSSVFDLRVRCPV